MVHKDLNSDETKAHGQIHNLRRKQKPVEISMGATLRRSVYLATSVYTPPELRGQIVYIRSEEDTRKRTKNLLTKVLGINVDDEKLSTLSIASSFESLITNPIRLRSAVNNARRPDNKVSHDRVVAWIKEHADPFVASFALKNSPTPDDASIIQTAEMLAPLRGDIKIMRLLGTKEDDFEYLLTRQNRINKPVLIHKPAVLETSHMLMLIRRMEYLSERLKKNPEDSRQVFIQ